MKDISGRTGHYLTIFSFNEGYIRKDGEGFFDPYELFLIRFKPLK